MKIYLTYCANQSVEFCFWKYFFMVTGVWTEEVFLLQDDYVDSSKVPQLVLLDHNFEDRILESECDNIFYCVKSTSTINRKDVIKSVWYDEKVQKGIIKAILTDTEQEENLKLWYKMLEIFKGKWFEDLMKKKPSNGLWAASWLFHEINYSNQVSWDSEISKICRYTLHYLKEYEDSKDVFWNYRYMILYCKYLQYAVDKGNSFNNESCDLLLKECVYLGREKGWRPTLSLLIGKISLLTPYERKTALYYYKDVSAYSNCTDIYYEIGYIYEKIYADKKRALCNYYKAYQCDKYNYRALYKMALDLENCDQWVDALSMYLRIKSIIKSYHMNNLISVRPLEYLYKLNKRIMYICKIHSDDESMLKNCENVLTDFQAGLKSCKSFARLMGAMFDDETARNKLVEIKDELLRKVNGDYCR